jgi:ribonuclease HII
MPDFAIENLYHKNIIVGVDEVGRGSWAGPVVAGAVIINRIKDCSYIDDSKQIPKAKRESFYNKIIQDHDFGIGAASVQEIVQLGLNQATFLAMDRAIAKLKQKPTFALIDGNYKFNIDLQYKSIIKGDCLSISIAAASIIAKVYRDNLMIELAKIWQNYKWETNVGYGTKDHLVLIKKHGICEHHRTNYKPIQEMLVKEV